jgi:hypothetical protein
MASTDFRIWSAGTCPIVSGSAMFSRAVSAVEQVGVLEDEAELGAAEVGKT